MRKAFALIPLVVLALSCCENDSATRSLSNHPIPVAWGETVNGLQLGLGPTNSRIPFDAGIPLRLSVKNVSDKPVLVCTRPPFFWDAEVTGEGAQAVQRPPGPGRFLDEFLEEIGPGQTKVIECFLGGVHPANMWRITMPGRYSLHVVYENLNVDRPWPMGTWLGTVKSGTIEIDVGSNKRDIPVGAEPIRCRVERYQGTKRFEGVPLGKCVLTTLPPEASEPYDALGLLKRALNAQPDVSTPQFTPDENVLVLLTPKRPLTVLDHVKPNSESRWDGRTALLCIDFIEYIGLVDEVPELMSCVVMFELGRLPPGYYRAVVANRYLTYAEIGHEDEASLAPKERIHPDVFWRRLDFTIRRADAGR